MSVSSGPMKFETANCTDGEAQARGEDRGQDLDHAPPAGESTTRYAGTSSEKKGSWRPTIDERACVVVATSRPRIGASRPPRVVTGMPIEPKATGAVLATRARTAAADRLEAEPGEHRGGDRDRGAEAGDALDERAEAEGDEKGLDAPVLGEPRQGAADHVEVAARHGQVVEEDGVQADPADRPEAEGHAVGGGGDARGRAASARRARRAAKAVGGAGHRRLPGRGAHHRQQDGEDDEGQRGDEGRERMLPATGS